MTACKMKHVRYARCRKKTENQNRILMFIVMMEMYCDNKNVS